MKKWLCVLLTVALFCLPMFSVVGFAEEIVSDAVEVVDEEPIPEAPEDTPAEVEADTIEAEADEYPLADESATNDVETSIEENETAEEVLIETEEVSEEASLASTKTWDVYQNELWRYNGSETDIVIPSNLGITSISSGAFKSNNIKSITVPKGVTELDDFVFSSLKSLTKVVLPEGLTEIPDYAFYSCSNLREVNIPNTVTKIGATAFNGCSSLENISIPNSVIDIGDRAFYGCVNLKSLSIPDGVEVVNYGLCWDCSSLEKVNLGKNVNLISTYAFCDCTKLSTINFPSALTIIEYQAFFDCTSLKSITLNKGLLIIDDLAFSGTGINRVIIPETVTNMTKYSFSSNAVLVVYKGSYAHNFCVANKIKYEVIDIGTTPEPMPDLTPYVGVWYWYYNETDEVPEMILVVYEEDLKVRATTDGKTVSSGDITWKNGIFYFSNMKARLTNDGRLALTVNMYDVEEIFLQRRDDHETTPTPTPTPAPTPKPTPVPTPKPTPVPTQTAKYSINLTDVTKTNNTAGKGTVTAANGNLGSTLLYARVTWVYTLSSGDSFAYCAMKTVEMDNGSFNMVSPKAPYGATLDSVQIALVTDPYADASGTYTALATARK